MLSLPTTHWAIQRWRSIASGLLLGVAIAGGGTAFGDDAASLPSQPTPADLEYLKRWTPGGDTNARDLPYPQITEKFQYEGEADWRDDRWQRTDKGPFVAHSILLSGYNVGPKLAAVAAMLDDFVEVFKYDVGPKLTAVAAGEGRFLLFDLEAGSFVAGVSGGELKIDPARFGILNRPVLTGDVEFHVPANRVWRHKARESAVDRSKIDYQGLYLHNDRVVLATKVDGIDVLESPPAVKGEVAIVREFELGPRDAQCWTCLAEGEAIEVMHDGRRAVWRDRNGVSHAVTLKEASAGVSLEVEESSVLLRWPATSDVSWARVAYERIKAHRGKRPAATAAANNSPTAPVDLSELKVPGGKRWGEPLAERGDIAAESDHPYVVDRIPPPYDNPYGALFFLSGIDFFPHGDAAVCTVHGDVWIVRGLDAGLQRVTWQRFATGLYQPLGLEVVDGKVLVLGRDQLTRLHDENQDGEADFYESFNHDLICNGLPHAYAMRLERMPDGSFVFLKSGEGPHGSALLRVSADGSQLEVLARGFRHPFGIGAGPSGEITAADNEGNWVPASKIDLITPGGFYGFLGSAEVKGENPEPLRPLCYIPKAVDNSSGGQFWHTSDRWGPYHRCGMWHFSWGRCTLHAVLEQHAGGAAQAATVAIPGVRLQAGPGEAEFNPRDGQLYVVGLDGWQTAAAVDGTLERIRYNGKPVRLPSSFAAYEGGIEVGFDESVDPESLQRSDAIRVEQWNYKWTSTYGSYHFSVSHPDRVGHDRVAIDSATLSRDGKRLFIAIATLQPVDQIQISLDLQTVDGAPIMTTVYGTLNALPLRDANARTSVGGD
jgi:hypothetical protein